MTFVVAAPDGEGTDIVTFRRDDHGELVEDRGVRGLHPLIAERLDLWRLTNFELERLPADQDVHLFRATARENERDERLVAVAEVRDMTPVRDERGRIVALPALERTARQAFEAMRTFQSRRRSRERLQWNRVMLYAWPAVDFEPDEARAVISEDGPDVGGARTRDGDAPGQAGHRRRRRPRGRAAVLQPRRPRRRRRRSIRCRPSRCSRSTTARSGS